MTARFPAILEGVKLLMTDTPNKWDQFALLLIDVQRDFWPEGLAQVRPEFPANIAALLTFCRTEGIEVVHLRASFKADTSHWMPRYRLRGSIPCLQGTAGAAPTPFAVEKPGERIILKQTFDGFHNPERVNSPFRSASYRKR